MRCVRDTRAGNITRSNACEGRSDYQECHCNALPQRNCSMLQLCYSYITFRLQSEVVFACLPQATPSSPPKRWPAHYS